jgi:hypothetical protein
MDTIQNPITDELLQFQPALNILLEHMRNLKQEPAPRMPSFRPPSICWESVSPTGAE